MSKPYRSPSISDFHFGSDWQEECKVGVSIKLNFEHAARIRDQLSASTDAVARQVADELERVIAACTPT